MTATAATALVGILVLSAPRPVGAREDVLHAERQTATDTNDSESYESFLTASLSMQQAPLASASAHRPMPTLSGTAIVGPGAIKTVKRPPPPPPPAPEPEPTPVVIEPARIAVATPTPTPTPAPAPVPQPKPAPETDTKQLPDQETISISWGGQFKSDRFGYGYCTEWVAKKRGGVRWLGNANEWPAGARAAGVPMGSTPAVGAIMVTGESGWGHVAFVESVDWANKTFTVSEQNYRGWNIVTRRTLPFNSGVIITFIY